MTQKEFKPKVVGFLCNWCSYAGADLAGTSRFTHDISTRVVRVMCSGRVEPSFVMKAFLEGADGVIIAGCHIPADCHYTSGNFKALARYETFLPLLEEMGIEKDRLQLHWISASEGEKYAKTMNEFVATIKELGPLNLKETFCPLKRGADPKTFTECSLIRKVQEFVACEAAVSGMVDLEQRKNSHAPLVMMEPSVVYDPNKCIRCGSCVEACREQGVEALKMDDNLGVIVDADRCVRCGQCIMNCPLSFQDKTVATFKEWTGCNTCPYSRPVGAVTEKDDVAQVIEALNDKSKYVVVEMAPSIRAAIGEEFGMNPGDLATGKLYTALRAAGFKKVWDTNFSADLTIMEEGTELIHRIQNGGVLPQFTSCCPAWIKFVETYYPELIPHLSSAKSPQQMFGAVAKTYGAKELQIDPAQIVNVSIMPCTAKKFERGRDEMNDASEYWKHHGKTDDYADIDYVLTTRETAKLLKLLDIDLAEQKDGDADALLGAYTGAATIFGRTGGVMTAALRTAYELLTGKELDDPDLAALGAYEGIKTASVDVAGTEIKVAVVFGLANARRICEDIKNGGEFSKYHFIEVMTCPGGCIAGGGQIITTNVVKAKARTAGLNLDDKTHALRKSHDNPEIGAIYENFFEKPCSELSHHLLHTGYTDRSASIK